MYKYLLPACLLLLAACGKKDEKLPFNKDDHAPAPVTNVRVEALPGGARITYDRPNDENLLYVKAEYAIRDDLQREVKASYYKNNLIIDGLPDTSVYEIRLYTVSRGEHASDPVIVSVRPKTPPVIKVYKTLRMEGTYGGIRVYFENESEADVVLTVLAADSIGDLVPAETYYTKRPEGTFAARGFNTDKRKFAVFVRDRWDNHSDTLYADLAPLPEKMLDKTKFKEVHLDKDTYAQHAGGKFTALWDNSWNNGSFFHTPPGSGLPQWFTFDLGAKYDLSRFKFYHRRGAGQGATDGAYTGADPMVFEIWGSNDPNPDGTWDSWIKLGEFHSVKPSGSPEGTVTNEDFQFAVVDGEDFDFPPNTPPVRYLRWKTLKVWGALDHHYISELTFWGDDDITNNP